MLKNKFVISFIIIFLGFLSLSFVGIENKNIRFISIIIVIFIILSYRNMIYSIIRKDRLLKNLFLFFLTSIPSILFCNQIAKSGFKLLELFILVSIIALGVLYFKIDNKRNVFMFICWYYVFQTVITILGYFFDPTSIASDTGYGNYVTFLHCNYPPIHGNSIGEFGGVTSLFIMVYYYVKNKSCKINYIKKLSMGLLCIAGIAVLYLSSSRTCMIASSIGLVFLFLKLYNSKTQIKITAIIICSGLVFSQQIIDKATSIMMKKQNEETLNKTDNEADALSSGRLSIWENALHEPHKLIFGNGYGVASSENDIGADNAHNSVIEILYNSGIFALFFWLNTWIIMYQRYRWLCNMKKYLPCDIAWVHLGATFAIISIIRSIGNVSFVYLQLNVFHTIASITLFSYCRIYILHQLKNKYER